MQGSADEAAASEHEKDVIEQPTKEGKRAYWMQGCVMKQQDACHHHFL